MVIADSTFRVELHVSQQYASESTPFLLELSAGDKKAFLNVIRPITSDVPTTQTQVSSSSRLALPFASIGMLWNACMTQLSMAQSSISCNEYDFVLVIYVPTTLWRDDLLCGSIVSSAISTVGGGELLDATCGTTIDPTSTLTSLTDTSTNVTPSTSTGWF
jgi:hypothetical protein